MVTLETATAAVVEKCGLPSLDTEEVQRKVCSDAWKNGRLFCVPGDLCPENDSLLCYPVVSSFPVTGCRRSPGCS